MNPGETIHVVLSIYDKTGEYSQHAGVTLASVFANTDHAVCAHILHDETLSEDNRCKLQQVAAELGKSIEFHPVVLPESLSSVDYGVLTRGAVYRLMIPDVLSQDKAIYLDGDIVVDMDIAELWAVDMAKRCVAVVRDLDRQYWGKAHWERVRHIGVSPELYFNSGVIVMNLTLIRQKHNLLAELPAFLREYPKATVVDQDYLNRLFFQDCVWLTERFNRFVAGWRGGWSSEGSSGAIWHWAGPDDKPWKGFVAPVDILYWRYLVLTPWYSQAEAGIGYFSAEVDRLTSSRSWKMTRPYRVAADWLRINARRWLSRS